MKYIAVFTLMLWTTALFAEQTITLEPGSRVTIEPTDTTVVVCGGTANNDHYCLCDYTPRTGWALQRVTWVNGQRRTDNLRYFGTDEALCHEELPQHPACAQSWHVDKQ